MVDVFFFVKFLWERAKSTKSSRFVELEIELLAEIVEDVHMGLEPRVDEVGHAVGLPGRVDKGVLLQDLHVVLHRPVLHPYPLRELVHVPGLVPELMEKPRPCLPTPRGTKEVPQETTQ